MICILKNHTLIKNYNLKSLSLLIIFLFVASLNAQSDTKAKLIFERKIDYDNLNSKEKENHNYHKIAASLADYGYDSMRLNNDWEGADFIAIRQNKILKIQLKGRFTIDKKYIGKDIFVSFLEEGKIKIYYHDEALKLISKNVKNSKSWNEFGNYSWGKTPEYFNTIITTLN